MRAAEFAPLFGVKGRVNPSKDHERAASLGDATDFLSDRITEAFWTLHSAQWEVEINTIDRELSRLEHRNGSSVVSTEKTLE